MPSPGRDQDIIGLRRDIELLQKHVYLGNGRPSLLETARENTLKIEEIERDVKEIKDEQKEFRVEMKEVREIITKNHEILMGKISGNEKDVQIKFSSNQIEREKMMVNLARAIAIGILIIIGLIALTCIDAEIMKQLIKAALAFL